MTTRSQVPPIQLAPVKHFTVRLVNGHFVRVPKVEILAATNATRPPSERLPKVGLADRPAIPIQLPPAPAAPPRDSASLKSNDSIEVQPKPDFWNAPYLIPVDTGNI